MAEYNLGTARGSIQIDTNDLKSADIALRGAGRSLVAFGALAIGAFGYVVGVGAQFEKEMSFVQAVTNASEADMKKLTDAAIELGKKGPFGPREVAAGFVDLAKAGLSAQEIIDGVGAAAVNLAAAGDIPFTQSAEVLVNILRAFNLPASEATKVIDSLAGAANASTVDIADMATSLTYAAAPAAAGKTGKLLPMDFPGRAFAPKLTITMSAKRDVASVGSGVLFIFTLIGFLVYYYIRYRMKEGER